jgi:CDP-glycerol glycerophosphotransferase (TagB/SpsB family)/glycosyltransferase involved in cell wall biosynthesis
MRRFLRKIKKLIKKRFNRKNKYIKLYEKKHIINRLVFFEAMHGGLIEGNIFALLKELSRRKYDFKIVVASKDIKRQKNIFAFYGINNITFVKYNSYKYLKFLSRSKYLFNDTTFLPYFIKNSQQIYINTWHGTPLKTIGKKMQNPCSFGNTQRNFILSDFIFLSNQYTINEIVDSHDLSGIFKGKMLLSPSPKNSIFFQDNLLTETSKKMRVIYMPTWRGNVNNKLKDYSELYSFFDYLEINLNNNIEFYVKLHPTLDNLNLDKYKKINDFPNNMESYSFLSSIDILVTDYSSIMFDFACQNKEIVLFCYDKDEYLNDRGLNMEIDTLPFVQISKISELCHYLNNTNKKVNYDEFNIRYNSLDNKCGAKEIIDYLFENISVPNIKEINILDKKETVFLISGAILNNGITRALFNLLNLIDTSKRNYYICFYTNIVNSDVINKIRELPANIKLFPIPSPISFSFKEKKIYSKDPISSDKIINKALKREITRTYGHNYKLDYYIHYTGYARLFAAQLPLFDCKKMIFVHSDMFKEYQIRANYSKDIIYNAYNESDKIVLVNDKLVENFIDHLPYLKNKINVAHNLIDYKYVINQSKELLSNVLKDIKVHFGLCSKLDGNMVDKTSNSFIKEQLIDELKDDNIKFFINVGRFDENKGHDRLIEAYEKLSSKNTRLLIIAPSGDKNIKKKTISLAKESIKAKEIYIIGNMNNPYPLIKECDAFVLTSYYEALNLALYEALSLGLIGITVNLPTTIKYLNNNSAIIVENSNKGIYEGMLKFINNDYLINEFVEFDKINQNSIIEWENLFID